MAGERILVVDDSVAVQELCRTTLENKGYRVTVASNGVAALAHPDMAEVDLLVIDSTLHETNAATIAQAMRRDPELCGKPVLVLVPEEEAARRESENLGGADAFLLKPFEPGVLANKVRVMLEEKEILDSAREHLRQTADAWMKRVAESHIQAAVEARTQIIIERALQHIVTQIDQKARREVDARMTQLTAEKEQELVKMTVHEVARSMVEKLAERKVTEAMEAILRDETDKNVRRVAEGILPSLTRERVRETVEQVLPKEVQRRVQKEAENLVPEASTKVVQVIETAAQKLVPKIARELVTEQVEKQTQDAIQMSLPRHVQSMVGTELEAQMRNRVGPLVKESADQISRRLSRNQAAMVVLLAVGLAGAFLWVAFAPGSGVPVPFGRPRVAATPAPAPQPTPPPLVAGMTRIMERLSQATTTGTANAPLPAPGE